MGFPGGSDGKEFDCNAGDPGSSPGSGRYPGEGNDNPRQYPCLENPMDRGAWQATVHGITKMWKSAFKICVSHIPNSLVKSLISLMMSQEFGGLFFFFYKSLRPEFISICKCSRHFNRAQRCSGLIKGHTEEVSVGSSIAKGSI